MLRISLSLALILIISCGSIVSGQTSGINRDNYRINISKTDEIITVDGVLDEPVWANADVAKDFRRVLPIDTGLASARTEVKMTYNETTMYVGIICYDPTPGKRPVESFRRDFSFMKNDNFIVFIDTYGDYTNGFAFGVSPAGAQWDGVQANGGTVNLDWDIKWRSEVKNYSDRWVAEFAIPFRSMRYSEGSPEWGINFSRQDLKINEKSSWAPMPRQFPTASLAFTGSLVWDSPLPKAGARFSIIPYASAKVTQDKLAGENFRPEKKDLNGGLDAKITLSTSMNLDLTVNPDYSQVEVDRQVTNLDRFELFFPEKRQFYLENSDLFANLGTENVRPFFSRRIGLNSPVIAGARLSGKIGTKWRLGLMDIQTNRKDEVSGGNFAVMALQRQVSSHSNITAFMVNKEVTAVAGDSLVGGFMYNRVTGLEYNLATPNNRWTGKAFWHHSFTPEDKGMTGSSFAANVLYSTQYIKATLNQSLVGPDYFAEVGYIRRKGYYELNPTVQYKFFPAGSKIANHGPGLKTDFFFDYRNLTLTDRDLQFFYQIEWLNRSLFQADIRETYVKLRSPFDPTNTGGAMLGTFEKFDWIEAGLAFTSDIRKPFNYLAATRYGGFYNGTKWTVNGEVNYRVQPYASLAIVASYNDIELPKPYNSAEFILVGPRLDLTFTEKLFFTSFVQYNNQIDNLNLNLRFQWRFAPVSDLFIVYTENSFPGNYSVKNRGLVFKVSYWFN
ncbi:MAG TPA: DUF5916 domain-containing protein [Bacteroidales bacterium]|nr:DUF5916 domain-containing protein [Bacteroidales bacterium]